MHLFLIRHGETEHNVAGLLAGVTDSRLTNHGVIQTQRLGTDLVKTRGLHFNNVYSSDLQRAFMTANEICKAQLDSEKSARGVEVVKLEMLREVDFGSLELVSWSSRRVEEPANGQNDASFKPKETTESMKSRANAFVDDYIAPLLAFDHEEAARIAIVSHGIFLSHLWRALLARFGARSVVLDPSIMSSKPVLSFEHMSWSNTGYLEVDIQCPPDDNAKTRTEGSNEEIDSDNTDHFKTAKVTIKSINDKRHLVNLRRARGGIGSAAHDQRQKDLNTYFRKRKTAPANIVDPAPKRLPDNTPTASDNTDLV